MKKLISIVLVVCMALALVACNGSGKEAEYKLGMGVTVSLDTSDTGNAQVDATVATVVLDADGKIVACRLDCAQSKMDVKDGAVDTKKTFKSKVELKEDYGMVQYSDATLEWYEQAENFEKYVTGKTAAEVKATKTTVNDHGYNVAADETLHASCSIDIVDFLSAVDKACNDAKGSSFKAKGTDFKLGLACITHAEESTAATDDAEGVVKMYTEFGATVVGADGKILCAIEDEIQPQIGINKAGEITKKEFKGTKRELGSDYGMVQYGSSIAEWDAQSKAFTDYTVGKTAAEVRALETKKNDHGYNVTTDETLSASCTIQITGMMAVIAQAADYAD